MQESQSESFEKVWEKLSKLWFNTRSAIVSTIWKAMHLIISKWNKSLEETSNKYLENIWVESYINHKSRNELDEFKWNEKWLIISSHKSGNFADYLPIFAKLWDDILKKTIFYTWKYNLEMNRREFPDYNFQPATSGNITDSKKILENLEINIKKIENEWWYIFIMPSWANIDNNWEFKGIFKRIMNWLWDEFPILANNIEHNWNWTYPEIWKSLIWLWDSNKKTKIDFKNATSSDFKDKNGEEMREFYNLLFEEKN